MVDPDGEDAIVDFFAAWGDTLTFGLTKVARRYVGEALGIGDANEAVDYSSGAYRGGQITGTLHSFAFGFAGGAKAAAARSSSTIEGQITKKMAFAFGEATGTAANIQRSAGNLAQLTKIGFNVGKESERYLVRHFANVLRNPASIAKTLGKGRVLRESLLMGPKGGLKVNSIWEGKKLITFWFQGR